MASASLELRSWVAVSLECSIYHIRANIDHVWHDWLVHRTIPRNISWLSVSVPIGILVVLMEDWGLSCSPFSVGIWKRRVSWQNSCQVPVEQVWVVDHCLRVDWLIVKDYRSCELESSSESLDNEEQYPEVSQPASDIEVLDW